MKSCLTILAASLLASQVNSQEYQRMSEQMSPNEVQFVPLTEQDQDFISPLKQFSNVESSSKFNERSSEGIKLQQNIYTEVAFTDSDYYDFWEAFLTGAKLSQFYDYSDDCVNATDYILDSFNSYYLNDTDYQTTNTDWEDFPGKYYTNAMFFWSYAITNEYNDAIYYCYLFIDSVVEVTTENLNAFEDGQDVWISFLFNMLSASLSMYNIVNSMVATTTEGEEDWVQFVNDVTKLLRILLDFQSSTAMGITPDFLGEYLKQADLFANLETEDTYDLSIAGAATLAGLTVTQTQVLKEKNNLKEFEVTSFTNMENLFEMDQELAEFDRIMKQEEPRLNSEHMRLKGDGYIWKAMDYFWAFFGFIDGALSALPQTSYAYKCNQNFTDFRDHLDNAINHWIDGDTKDGFKEFHYMFDPVNKIFVNCALAVDELQEEDSYFDISDWQQLLLNIIYNIGFMVVDGFEFFLNNYETYGEDWPYYALKIWGDFLMRFFSRDDGSLETGTY